MLLLAMDDRPVGFYLYIVFLISHFLHLPARIEVLGAIRFDLCLMLGIALAIVAAPLPLETEARDISRKLYILFFYILATLPFVEWPGSVLKNNLPVFAKGVAFFFFTVHTVNTEKRLRIFMAVFIVCQTFRVLEPVWMHVTQGYWGSSTHMGEGIMQDRLAGSPYDIINSNGLAWIIVSVIPFMYFLTLHSSLQLRLLFYSLAAVFLYALQLSQSRSGLIGFAVVLGGIIWKSRHRMIWICLAVLCAAIIFVRLDPLSQDRYMSLYRSDVRGAATAQDRVNGWVSGLKAVLNHPLLGHGLGTSKEVGANIAGYGMIAHNLYIEVLQELGLAGFIIFAMYINSIIGSFFVVKRMMLERHCQGNLFLGGMVEAMQIWIILAITFSMASYGLNEYTWYFFGGISAVLIRLLEAERTPLFQRGTG